MSSSFRSSAAAGASPWRSDGSERDRARARADQLADWLEWAGRIADGCLRPALAVAPLLGLAAAHLLIAAMG